MNKWNVASVILKILAMITCGSLLYSCGGNEGALPETSDLPSGRYVGYFSTDEDHYISVGGKEYAEISLIDDDVRYFTTEELLSLQEGQRFVYDLVLEFTIDSVEYDEAWHDDHQLDSRNNTDSERGYYRKDGKITVNDTYYFIHPWYTIEPESGVSGMSDEETMMWILATDDNQFGYDTCTARAWLPVSDKVVFYRDYSSETDDSGAFCYYPMSKIREYISNVCPSDTRWIRCYFTVRENEITDEFGIETNYRICY